MNVLVVGATGRVGQQLISNLLEEQHNVYAGSRRDELKHDRKEEITHVHLDLSESMEKIADALPENLQAVYFVAGSRGENLLQVDLDGAIKTMQAAADKGIKRYVMLSTIFATDKSKWSAIPDEMVDYYLAKHYADQYLIDRSGLDYTILQPGALKEQDGSGKIELNVNEAGENSISNVAQTLASLVKHPNTIGKVITMHDGDTPVDQAVAGV